MGLLEPHVGYRGCDGQAALTDDGEPSPRAQRLAMWGFGAMVLVAIAFFALVPDAFEEMGAFFKFISGYSEVERLIEN